VKTPVSFASCAAFAIAVMAAVTSCTSAPREVPGPTADELKAFGQFVLDDNWQSIELPAGAVRRPAISPERYIDQLEFTEVIYGCVRDYAAHDYRQLATYSQAKRLKKSGGGDFFDALAWYECSARFPLELDSLGLRSNAELTLIYEHFQRWVVPCLASYGYTVTTAPSRESFLEDGVVFWSPLEDLFREGTISDLRYAELREDCDVYPAWLFPSAYY
jgi:hypothetical protein